jgi:hypothetical protein
MRGGVIGRDGNADAGPNQDFVAVELERRPHGHVDPGGQRRRVGGLRQGGLQHSEFIATQSRDHICLAHDRSQPIRGLPQQFVTERVPERVVDVLEVIEIEIEKRDPLAPLRTLERTLELVRELHTVGQSSQQVVVRHVGDLLLRPFALGDVIDHGEEVFQLASFVEDR